MKNQPVGAVCDYPYPTYEQAICAGSEIYKKVTGQSDRDAACMIHCAYTVTGFGLSAYPHDHEEGMQAVGDGCPSDEKVAEAFKPLYEAQRGEGVKATEAIPWALIIQVALELLAEWRKRRQG